MVPGIQHDINDLHGRFRYNAGDDCGVLDFCLDDAEMARDFLLEMDEMLMLARNVIKDLTKN